MEILRQKGVLEVLFLLNEKSPLKITEIVEQMRVLKGMSSSTVYRALKILNENGLVSETEEESNRGGPVRRVFSITDKGKKIVSLLKSVEEEL